MFVLVVFYILYTVWLGVALCEQGLKQYTNLKNGVGKG